ncbi:MAG: hypothetical protein SCALA702_17000 [Melioribacteraceae bacterium]|nr:MAG: hypothetical protein SCALA702_17000 [Melioribacteraceae bacterium]
MKKVNTKLIYDLEWVISSPAIFNSGNYGSVLKLENNTLENLNLCADSRISLSDYSEKLTEFLGKKNTLLIGKYFEALFEFGLILSPDIDLLFSNQQITDHKNNTIGEIDFLYRDMKSGNLHHLELAGKFYLALNNIPDWNNFIGPNPADNLAKKMEHLVVKQVPLLKTDAGREFLKKHNLDYPVNSKYLLKGYIFYHYPLFQTHNFVSPTKAKKDHLKGWWIRSDEINLLEHGDLCYYILERKEWMRTMPKSNDDIMSFREVKDKVLLYFQHNNYPLLISRMREDVGSFKETDRGFIVSKFWPNTEQL